ncbi:hypothetical protein FB547_110199 [Variovorax beijingensis]|uniref:Uncharacterized protein n=1 Tax=Variovorax beijingensis TaxID=2496117 RepID=A0A561BEG6_9BURK|nr:hypothetical protein [Variovorax beijingensis]TWD77237.1 hypothetical protein FB547_110199 [Variovorax beijingensis]
MKDETLTASLLKSMTVECLLQRCYPVQSSQFVLMTCPLPTVPA